MHWISDCTFSHVPKLDIFSTAKSKHIWLLMKILSLFYHLFSCNLNWTYFLNEFLKRKRIPTYNYTYCNCLHESRFLLWYFVYNFFIFIVPSSSILFLIKTSFFRAVLVSEQNWGESTEISSTPPSQSSALPSLLWFSIPSEILPLLMGGGGVGWHSLSMKRKYRTSWNWCNFKIVCSSGSHLHQAVVEHSWHWYDCWIFGQ